MKAGDVILCRGTDWISRLIQWGTRSEYSHVAVCVDGGMNLAIEAYAGLVRAVDTRKLAKYDVFQVKPEHTYNLVPTLAFLVDKLNNRYDYAGVIYLGIMKGLSRIGIKKARKISNLWQKDRDYFCSELTYQAFAVGGGLDIVPQVASADITSPGDIAQSPILERV